MTENLNVQKLYIPVGAIGTILILVCGWTISHVISLGQETVQLAAQVQAIRELHNDGYHAGVPEIVRKMIKDENDELRRELISRLESIEKKLDRMEERNALR